MEYTITRATPEDAAELLAVLKQVGGESDNLSFGPEGLPFTVEEEGAYLANLQHSATSAFFVAKKDGKIVGNASFMAVNGPRMNHRGELGMSIVRSEWGKGVGTALVEAILDFARNTAGAKIISMEVRSDNTRAIRLCEKYGARKIGTFPGFFQMDGQLIDFDLMYLDL
ncbi:MAG: GNAT family N-acetyltransferase, partial [Ruminiclostridium sp.]|nr:GNAT family N-acetyltransferase [Ruminiclostridium sp.]